MYANFKSQKLIKGNPRPTFLTCHRELSVPHLGFLNYRDGHVFDVYSLAAAKVIMVTVKRTSLNIWVLKSDVL